jgi:hypothetical protein
VAGDPRLWSISGLGEITVPRPVPHTHPDRAHRLCPRRPVILRWQVRSLPASDILNGCLAEGATCHSPTM